MPVNGDAALPMTVRNERNLSAAAESLTLVGQSEAYMASADFDGALLARSVAHGTTRFVALLLLLGRYLVVSDI